MNSVINKYKREILVLAVTILMGVIFAVMNPNFLTWRNVLTVFQQMVLNGLLAVGIMFTIITAGIDLSIGCTFAIVGIAVAYGCVNDMNPILAIVIGIVIGAILGAFNGFLVCNLKLQPFIATLGTMSLYRGIAYVVTGGTPVTNVPDSFRNIFNGQMFAGIRYYVLVMIIVFILAHVILSKTRTGDYLYAVGGNEEAARIAGIKTDNVTINVYGISAVMASIGGILITCRLGTAQPTVGSDWVMPSVTAAAIGGTSLSGGRGSILGALIGGCFMGVVQNAITILAISAYWEQVITGAIILIAIAVDCVKSKRLNAA